LAEAKNSKKLACSHASLLPSKSSRIFTAVKVLLVEDEADLTSRVQRYLPQEHMVCEWAASYAEA
jgi:hypothetical protein